jgi:hypothetical protein
VVRKEEQKGTCGLMLISSRTPEDASRVCVGFHDPPIEITPAGPLSQERDLSPLTDLFFAYSFKAFMIVGRKHFLTGEYYTIMMGKSLGHADQVPP